MCHACRHAARGASEVERVVYWALLSPIIAGSDKVVRHLEKWYELLSILLVDITCCYEAGAIETDC